MTVSVQTSFSGFVVCKNCNLSVSKYSTMKLAIVNSIVKPMRIFAVLNDFSKNEKYNENKEAVA